MKIKEYICDCCGSNNFASLGFDKYMCNHCGTVVEYVNDNIVRLDVCPKSIRRLHASVEVSSDASYYFNNESITEYVMGELAKQISHELIVGGFLSKPSVPVSPKT